VVGQLFSGCKKTGEMQKADVFRSKTKTNSKKKQHHPKNAKTSRKMSENKLRFQNIEILRFLFCWPAAWVIRGGTPSVS